MVCAKCQKFQKTTLVTPGVKRKADIYYGSPAFSKSGDRDGKVSATLGQTGIGKVRLVLSYLLICVSGSITDGAFRVNSSVRAQRTRMPHMLQIVQRARRGQSKE